MEKIKRYVNEKYQTIIPPKEVKKRGPKKKNPI